MKKNIFLIGPMAVGKSTIGRYLARALGMAFYDSDREVEARSGVDIRWIFDVEGEEGFRRREQQVITELTRQEGIVLATGGDTILTAVNRAALVERGKIIYLQTSIDQQLARTELDRRRPFVQLGGRSRDTFEKINQERGQYYQQIADWTFSTDMQSPRVVTQLIIQRIQQEG